MQQIEKSVFLSYRRTNASWALNVYQNLTHHGFDVFYDFNGLASGDFEQAIFEVIRSRAHFIILLTPSALERCIQPTDLLRREIETALDSRRNVVPLMLDGFSFGVPEVNSRLTGKLAKLKRYNALDVRVDYFEPAMTRLRDRYLNVPLEAVLHPVSPAARQVTKDQQIKASAAPPVVEKELKVEERFERTFPAAESVRKSNFYDKALQLTPDDANAFIDRGVALFNQGDREGAMRYFSDAILLKPDDATAFHYRGVVLYDKGDMEGALRYFNVTILLKPDDVNALNNRGVALYYKGDFIGALRDYSEAIRLKPDHADAFHNRGVALYAKGDLEGALRDYSEAIRLKPDWAQAASNRAALLLKMSKQKPGTFKAH